MILGIVFGVDMGASLAIIKGRKDHHVESKVDFKGLDLIEIAHRLGSNQSSFCLTSELNFPYHLRPNLGWTYVYLEYYSVSSYMNEVLPFCPRI